MTYLALNFFGQFQVNRGNRTVAFGNEKAQALLAYLVTEERTHQRSALTALLWPNYREDSARTNLRQALHQLRTAIGDGEHIEASDGDGAADNAGDHFLQITRQTLQFNLASAYELDVHRFVALLQQCERHAHAHLAECAECLSRLDEAVALYRGPFLEGFGIADSIPFEEWRRLMQERLHLQMIGALEQLAGAYERLKKLEHVQRYAARWVELEPYHEEAHRQLMRVLALMGKPAAALAQYQLCRALLVKEIGVQPDAQTTALYEQIRTGQLRAAADAAPPVTPPVAAPVAEPEPQPDLDSHLLPTPLTQFVGRVDELNILNEWVLHPQHRLLTLTGPGGVGKTRLALELARHQRGRYPQGVFFVSLASIDSHGPSAATPIAIAHAIALAMGLDLQGSNPAQTLIRLLKDKQTLLVLDNFEQLLSPLASAMQNNGEPQQATALLLEMLQAAPKLKLVVTSRERLNVRGERVFGVGGMTYWPEMSLAEAAQSPAIALFLQSAQLVHPALQLSETNLPALLQICALVQGMPLGLEIAASWVGMFSLVDIAQAIQKDIDFLVVSWRDAPERHRSMRAVFEWSWRLLSPAEQLALCNCAVFQGGFSFEAFQAVVGVSQAKQAKPLIAQLISKSLLYQRDSERFELHELLRQFAEEHLRRNEAALQAAEQAHSAFYLRFVEARVPTIYTAQARTVAAEIREEIHNIHKALLWVATVGYRQPDLLDPLHQAIHGLWRYYKLTGRFSELLPQFRLLSERLVASDVSLSLQKLRAQIKGLTANALVELHQYEDATALAERAIELSGRDAVTAGLVFGALALGQVDYMRSQFDEAKVKLDEVRELIQRARAEGQTQVWIIDAELAASLWLAGAHREHADIATARDLLMRATIRSREEHSLFGEIHCLTNLAWPAIRTGDLATASQYYERSLALSYELNYAWGIGVVQREYGDLLRLQGHYSRAAELILAALPVLREIGNVLHECLAHVNLAEVFVYLGKFARVEEHFEQYRQTILLEVSIAYPKLYGLCPMVKFYRAIGRYADALAPAELALAELAPAGNVINRAMAHLSYAKVCTDLARWDEAETHYAQTIDLLAAVKDQTMTIEAHTGLGWVAFRRGNMAVANAQIERALALQVAHPIADLIDDMAVQWLHYQVLHASQNARALPVLQAACDRLNRFAETIHDEGDRATFLTQIEAHRQLLEAAKAIQLDRVAPPVAPSLPDRPPLAESAAKSDVRWDAVEMPADTPIYGREVELAQAERWLTHERSCVLAIVGIGGTGKTTLAAAAVRACASAFQQVIWRSVVNAPLASELLKGLLQVLVPSQHDRIPDSFDEQMRLLLRCLQTQRCLLVLDNLESLFEPGPQAGVFRSGYEGYAQLIQWIGSSDHQSGLVLTTRERPHVLTRLLGDDTHVHLLNLTGVGVQAGRAILQTQGIRANESETAPLIQRYSGNPLALRLVSHTIAELFHGNVAAFQHEFGGVFGDIRGVLDEQIARLSELELTVLLWLAITREPTSLDALRAAITAKVDRYRLLETMGNLKKRSLVESTDRSGAAMVFYGLQNVVLEYMTDHLIAAIADECVSGQLRVLHTHPVMQAQAKEYVRQAQVRLIVQPVAERLAMALGPAKLLPHLSGLLDQLRREPPKDPISYAGGTVLNVSLHLGLEISQLNFSALMVREAFLRDRRMGGANFEQADLTGAVLSDTFSACHSVAYNAVGNIMAAATSNGELRLWRADNHQPLTVLIGHSKLVWAVAGNPRHVQLASGGEDGSVRLWQRLPSPAPGHADQWGSRLLYQSAETVRAVAFHPSGDYVASVGDDPQIRVWNAHTGAAVAQLQGHTSWATALAFSPDGRWLVSCAEDGTVRLWNVAHLSLAAGDIAATPYSTPYHMIVLQALPKDTPAFWCVAISPDSATLLAGTLDGHLYAWSLAHQILLSQWQAHPGSIAQVGFSADGEYAASTGADTTIRLWDTRTWQHVRQLRGHEKWVSGLAFHPTARLLASVSLDNTVRIWDFDLGLANQIERGQSIGFDGMLFGEDDRTVITATSDGLIRTWHLPEFAADEPVSPRAQIGAVLGSGTNTVAAMAINSARTHIITGGHDYAVRVWDIARRTLLHTLLDHQHIVFGVAFHPDGNTFASGSIDQTTRIWDVQSGRCLHVLSNEVVPGSVHNGIWSVAYSRDGKLLAAGHANGAITLWAMPEARVVAVLRGHSNWVRGLAFNADGTRLASCSNDQLVCLWDITTQTLLHTWRGHHDWVMWVAWDPANRYVASCGHDQTIRLWRTDAPDEAPVVLRGHANGVSRVEFSPSGQWLASAAADGTIRIWRVGKAEGVLTIYPPGPYDRMNLTQVIGLTDSQRSGAAKLGAIV